MENTTQPIWSVTAEKRAEAVRRIVAAVKPRRVIVFGSQARNEGSADSDLDLMVIVDQEGREVERSIELRRTLSGLIMAVDILITSQKKFDHWCDTPGNIYYAAKNEGRVEYERGA